MWFLLIAALALFAAGCSRVVYPGDGRLVIVEIDPALDGCPVQLEDGSATTVGQIARAGIRYWDAAGARLRTADQLTAADQAEAGAAPRLRISGDSCQEAGADVTYGTGGSVIAPAGVAEYMLLEGVIRLHLRRWAVQHLSRGGLVGIATTIAHETGHALGLNHVPEADAIMCATAAAARDDLALADFREFARVWP